MEEQRSSAKKVHISSELTKLHEERSADLKFQLGWELAKLQKQRSAGKKFQISSELAKLKAGRVEGQRSAAKRVQFGLDNAEDTGVEVEGPTIKELAQRNKLLLGHIINKKVQLRSEMA